MQIERTSRINAGSLCLLLVCLGLAGCFRRNASLSGPAWQSLSAEESHATMATQLAQIAARVPDDNIFVGDRLARSLRQELASFDATTPQLKRWLKTYQLAKAELHLGNEDVALQRFESADQLIREQPQQVKREILRQFYFDRAVAYLRWGETQNCCHSAIAESCILPIRGPAVHQRPEGSRAALHWLRRVMQLSDPEEPVYLASRWLINIASMTLGEYPEGLTADDLIPGLDEAQSAAPAWRNVAREAGVGSFSLAGGAVADDFDNDGHMDLVVSSSDPRESLQVFWNRGDGTFDRGTATANVATILGGLNLTHTDYNNDGWLDVLVLRGGWLGAGGRHPNSLLRNNGDRTFTDVTFQVGLARENYPTQTACWADYDLDGDLDVYIGNESSPDLAAPGQLFRNESGRYFTDVTKSARVTNDRLAKAVCWGDVDQDGYPDLYVSNYRGENRLYHNRGDGTFRDVARSRHVEGPHASFPCWFCDVNQDGALDLFVAAYAGGIAEIAAAHLGRPFDRKATLPRLYLQSSSGELVDRAAAWGLVHPIHPMGANYGDLNNDGWLDFYFGTGWPEYHELMPNRLYMNRGEKFADVTTAARVGHLQKGHAVAMADFDQDGDLDLFEQMGGFVPGDKFHDVLYENPTQGRHWLKIQLQGRQSNRPGIGARLVVQFHDGEQDRSLYRHVSAGGSFGGNPLEQHFGLGSAVKVRAVEVFWPRSGSTDRFEDIEVDQRIRIVEGDNRLVGSIGNRTGP